jgi:hypothetical protein
MSFSSLKVAVILVPPGKLGINSGYSDGMVDVHITTASKYAKMVVL